MSSSKLNKRLSRPNNNKKVSRPNNNKRLSRPNNNKKVSRPNNNKRLSRPNNNKKASRRSKLNKNKRHSKPLAIAAVRPSKAVLAANRAAAPSKVWIRAGARRVMQVTVALRAGRACQQEAGVVVDSAVAEAAAAADSC